eukprot:14039153-Alexandrium_andersonii.AAC.1
MQCELWLEACEQASDVAHSQGWQRRHGRGPFCRPPFSCTWTPACRTPPPECGTRSRSTRL